MSKKCIKDVKELADFVELPPAEQKKIMKKVITAAVQMQRMTIKRADSL